MTVPPLASCLRQTNDSGAPGDTLRDRRDRLSSHQAIDELMAVARQQVPGVPWAFYVAGEQKRLLGQGALHYDWPEHIPVGWFESFCNEGQVHRWATGQGEEALGWLLAPLAEQHNPALADLAVRLGSLLQSAALIRAQSTQRALYEISLLASSTHERGTLLQGIHQQLGTLIDAEKFYLALYDSQSGKITYPYYIDRFDDEAMAPETFEYLEPANISMTGYVLTQGLSMFLDAAGIGGRSGWPFQVQRALSGVLDGRAAEKRVG